MNIRVSVIVPTGGQSVLLERCLTALLAQDFAAADYEIIVVDTTASNEIKQQVEERSRRVAESGHRLHYQESADKHGLAAARNRGWQAAVGEIIAFTNEDCIPEMGWLKAGVAAFTDNVAGVSGRVLVPLPVAPTDYEYNAARLERSEFVAANCFYRRDMLVALGGFDERFSAGWREDSDLFFTALERSLMCISAPSAIVMYPLQPVRWGISLFEQRQIMFDALLYKKHPALYQQRVQARPPLDYYCIVGVLLIALLGLFTAWPLALAAFCAWCGMTVRLCMQRLRKTSHAPQHVLEVVVTSACIPVLAMFWRIRGTIKFRVSFL